MTLSKETIGKRIAKARKGAKLTQAELAEEIGISEKYLSRIECGKQLPSIVIFLKICEVLYISVDELLGQAKGYSNQPVQNEMSGSFTATSKRDIMFLGKLNMMCSAQGFYSSKSLFYKAFYHFNASQSSLPHRDDGSHRRR